jgi:hypothetical protein
MRALSLEMRKVFEKNPSCYNSLLLMCSSPTSPSGNLLSEVSEIFEENSYGGQNYSFLVCSSMMSAS